eukprot:CAMPEP_0201519528 /NCGR_PEP_ID=MMETSP0161_2-20130828/10060_1 /ASSEMBLY_ACC=CAM_ASM_000251 /TAXON_ID=180227 /ORGANISM="Neoparamoeba aestuarina, Strain SoJaBio B1-5/56/2" /LENGTH=40 /DNA_ID= /DNA_START= /DNA_END= /DNA_ORIENTATION=
MPFEKQEKEKKKKNEKERKKSGEEEREEEGVCLLLKGGWE